MDLSIIIVNWNSKEYVRKCLLSIINETEEIEYEVIVVDNASFDGCEDMVTKEFSNITFIQSEENIGFARANNLGYEHSSGRSLLFLNPDTEILHHAINIMKTHLETLPDAGAIGCRLLNSDRSLQTSCIQPFPTLLNEVFDIEYLKIKTPHLSIWGRKPLYYGDNMPSEVDVISGACIMTSRKVFEEVMFFSTDYFMYSEDVDLCYKIKQKGYKIYFVNYAEIIHHGGGSSGSQNNFLPIIVMRESMLLFLRKTRGWGYAKMYRIIIGLCAICRIMLLFLMLNVIRTDLRKKSLIYSLNKWYKIFRWSMGLEGCTKRIL